jgi:hypothetical protein
MKNILFALSMIGLTWVVSSCYPGGEPINHQAAYFAMEPPPVQSDTDFTDVLDTPVLYKTKAEQLYPEDFPTK